MQVVPRRLGRIAAVLAVSSILFAEGAFASAAERDRGRFDPLAPPRIDHAVARGLIIKATCGPSVALCRVSRDVVTPSATGLPPRFAASGFIAASTAPFASAGIPRYGLSRSTTSTAAASIRCVACA